MKNGSRRGWPCHAVTAAVPMLLLTACTPGLTTRGPIGAAQLNSDSGLRYFLPQDLIKVEAMKTETVTARPAPDLSKRQEKTEKERQVSVDVETVADLRTYYLLDLGAAAFEDGSLKAKLNDRGFLTSINSESRGRAGDVIKNVVKLASVLVPSGDFGDKMAGATWPNEVPRCGNLDLRSLPILAQLLVKRNERGCTLWHGLEAKTQEIAEAESSLRVLNLTLAKAPSGQVADLLSRIETLEKETAALISQRRVLEASLENERQMLAKSLELGTTKSKPVVVSALFDPNELPSALDVRAGMRVDDAKMKLGPEAKDLLEKIGVVLTLQAIPRVACDPDTGQACAPPPDPKPSRIDCVKSQARGHARIYYRQSQPRVLTTLVEGEESKLELERQQVVELIDARDAARCFDFEASKFAVRTLKIDFDARGRPTNLERSATSSAAAVTGALADAAITARDTYTATLEKLATAETHKRTLALGEITTEVEALKKEKELLDAQLALEGATASQQLVLEQQQLAAQLSVLEAQLKLQQAQSGFDLQLEVAQLKLQLEQLQQQLAVLNARLALEEAQKK